MLGEVSVTASRAGRDLISETLTEQTISTYSRERVTDALGLLPGVAISTNQRNEGLVFVRGFDSRQVPLFIDGIPVYIPYDGYMDFNRFLTSDLAAIQLSKGATSVLYGPNTLGGAINLVSRKPTEAFEGNVSAGFGSNHTRQASANLGSQQDTWYLQLSGAWLDTGDFKLSRDFVPNPYEDGGYRDNSEQRDSKVSLKVGLTPKPGDEYSLSYLRQWGKKEQATSISLDPAARHNYWRWPEVEKESVYFISNTQLGDSEYLKLRLYRDQYDNELNAYTDASYSKLDKTSANFKPTGRSLYSDLSYGGSIEAGSDRLDGQALRGIIHYRDDEHSASNGVADTEHFRDRLYSYGVEDAIALSERWMIVAGLSRDELKPIDSGAFALPAAQSAGNGMLGVYFNPAPEHQLYAQYARKSRLPTLKDRYSARMGQAVPNPRLQPEKADHYEVGYRGAPWRDGRLELAVYDAEVDKLIQQVNNVAKNAQGKWMFQLQNVGEARRYGLDLLLEQRVLGQLELRAGYSFLKQENLTGDGRRLTGSPEHRVLLGAVYHAGDGVDLIADAEYNGKRADSQTADLPSYALANVKASWRPARHWQLDAGVKNLLDKNYLVADGFPGAGRYVFGNVNYRF
ncbi:TonB-dependent receptor [Crenobacter cavernae]|uniref:TonB-dependent receptor n=1 Tax=Crenobacter cavernae TaxID=2290923 RepID=A0ABY0FIJ6_9NEIS|nr:TonB-dependent receptor [Crenobacter cavernae]RXZ44879.1 TonB-dependent receptor [Crenobacter cavernae]